MEGNIDKRFSFAKDITFVEDNLPFKRKQYIVGSKEKNSYFHVSYEQFHVLQKIKEYVENGVKSPLEIQTLLHTNEKVIVDVNSLYDILDKNSLLEHSSRNTTNSETDRIGICLYKKELHFTTIRTPNLIPLKIFILIALLIGVLIIANNYSTIAVVLQTHKFTLNNSSIKGFFLGGVISFFVLTLHELAHIIAARNVGMSDAKFAIILYASFIPTYFTRYDGIELRKYKDRIRILSAGLKVNLCLLVFSAALLALPNMDAYYYDIVSKLSIVNLQFIGINISPFAMNDGYFMMLNFLGLSGIRMKMWNILRLLATGDRRAINGRGKGGLIIYTLISLGFIGINAWIILSWIAQILREIF